MSVETSQSTKTWQERQRQGRIPIRPPWNNKKDWRLCRVFLETQRWGIWSHLCGRTVSTGARSGCLWVGILYTWQWTRTCQSNAPTKRARLSINVPPPLPVKNFRCQKSNLREQGRKAKPKLNWWFIDVRHVLKHNSCLMIIMPSWGA